MVDRIVTYMGASFPFFSDLLALVIPGVRVAVCEVLAELLCQLWRHCLDCRGRGLHPGHQPRPRQHPEHRPPAVQHRTNPAPSHAAARSRFTISEPRAVVVVVVDAAPASYFYHHLFTPFLTRFARKIEKKVRLGKCENHFSQSLRLFLVKYSHSRFIFYYSSIEVLTMGRAVATPRQLRHQRDVLILKYFSRISGKLNQIHLNF